MEPNVGGVDRTARLVIGALLAVAGGAAIAGYWQMGVVAGGAGIIAGAILLTTGTTQKCPINQVTGVDTYEE